jgi:hypothetical protein
MNQCMSDPTYTEDDKYRVLAEHIDKLERRSEKDEYRQIVRDCFLHYNIFLLFFNLIFKIGIIPIIKRQYK